MKVIIMSGLPGSGKSTWANKEMRGPGWQVKYSADDHHVVNGVYRFNPANIGLAHDRCLKDVIATLRSNDMDLVIVDNTNLSGWEIAPYYRLAQIYYHEVEIVRVETDPELAFARQTHGVPRANFSGMVERWNKTLSEIPPWWNVRSVSGLE